MQLPASVSVMQWGYFKGGNLQHLQVHTVQRNLAEQSSSEIFVPGSLETKLSYSQAASSFPCVRLICVHLNKNPFVQCRPFRRPVLSMSGLLARLHGTKAIYVPSAACCFFASNDH
jgi:hypothetical protein